MSNTESSSMSENKFVEVVELLLKQQHDAEARRESAEREQLSLLTQVQARLDSLGELIEAFSAAEKAFPMPKTSVAPVAAAKPVAAARSSGPSDALSEWERQKQLLLQGLESPSEPSSTHTDTQTESAPPEVHTTPSEPSTNAAAAYDWIEHLDLNDPALLDEDERRNLVARLRKLEVELSLERATLARERSELDAKLSDIRRNERQQGIDQALAADGKNKEQGTVNRMLRFLGRKTP